MRFANPSYTLTELRALLGNSDNLLGKGRQGVVVKSEDGALAIKRQPLEVSEQEARHRVTPASGAYMTARVGQEGLGPRVFQYEEDPANGVAYLVMENLSSSGYKPLADVESDQEAYKKLYAQQMLLEAKAAKAGINLRDTHSANVMFRPEDEDIKFIDQGYSRMFGTERERNIGQVLSAAAGLRNLNLEDLAEAFTGRLRNEEGKLIGDAEVADLANESLKVFKDRYQLA